MFKGKYSFRDYLEQTDGRQSKSSSGSTPDADSAPIFMEHSNGQPTPIFASQ